MPSQKRKYTSELLSPENLALKAEIGPRETPADAKHRRDLEQSDAIHERWKDRWLFRSVTAIATLTWFVCLTASFLPYVTAEEKRWANSLVATITASALSYWAGKQGKSSK